VKCKICGKEYENKSDLLDCYRRHKEEEDGEENTALQTSMIDSALCPEEIKVLRPGSLVPLKIVGRVKEDGGVEITEVEMI